MRDAISLAPGKTADGGRRCVHKGSLSYADCILAR